MLSPEGREYLFQQAQEEAARGLEKKINPKRLAREEAKLRKPGSGKEKAGIAARLGLPVVNGGREGTYIQAPNGIRQPVSIKGGGRDLSPGLNNAVSKFIRSYIPIAAAG